MSVFRSQKSATVLHMQTYHFGFILTVAKQLHSLVWSVLRLPVALTSAVAYMYVQGAVFCGREEI